MEQNLKVKWVDLGREPQCPPDPDHPNGIDIDLAGGRKGCHTLLPYPAKRCGYFLVQCDRCGQVLAATTAGRPDDPISISIPCKKLAGEDG